MNDYGNKRKTIFLLLIIVAIVAIFSFIIFFAVRDNKKAQIDKLIEGPSKLIVDFGEVKYKKVLKEKNNLLKRVFPETNYYFYINDDNTAFAYYLQWYYQIDPLKGHVLAYKETIPEEKVNDIMEKVEAKLVDDLNAKVASDYVRITYGYSNKYIKKIDMLYILNDNGIYLDLW